MLIDTLRSESRRKKHKPGEITRTITKCIKNELMSLGSSYQKWYTGDGIAVGKLGNLRTVLDKIVSLGRFFGFHVQASKCRIFFQI